MRQIGFRGKCSTGEWHYGLLAQSAGLPGQPDEGVYISNTVCAPYAFQVIPDSVGEYIGKLDTEKKKIFEGDIVKRRGDSRFKVEYDERKASFMLSPIIAPYPMTFWELETYDEVVTVIGNVCDDPELLNPDNNIK